MSLRRQLLALSLLLLSLPWAGCEFLREMERTLRSGQGLAVQATAEAIATALSVDSDLLYPARARRFVDNPADWYLPRAEQPLIADGYDDDWRDQSVLAPLADTPTGVRLQAGTRGERLYLLLRVQDRSLRYLNPSAGTAVNGDRLLLDCIDARGQGHRYRIATAAPGLVRARSVAADSARADRIRGTWRETGDGFQIELQLPLGSDCERLGLRVVDASADGERLRFNSRSLFGGELPWLIYRVPALEERLAAYGAPGRSLSVRDRQGWVVAKWDAAAETFATQDGDVFWLLRLLYRALLTNSQLDEPQSNPSSLESDNAAAGAAPVEMEPGAAPMSRDREAGLRSVTATAPFADASGAVRVRETRERYLALTDRSTGRVLGISALVLGIALLCLLAYASLLSWRVSRLRDAARDISAERLPADAFPRSRAPDELGELSRSYADLLRQIDEYNRYLRSLARSLSHELRTPMAIIGSSLEHLGEGDSATPAQRTAYIERGRAGLQRLTRIVSAMSEVSRLEESLTSADHECLSLQPFLAALCEGYRGAYADQDIRLQLADDSSALQVKGNGDLLAQAMDKLIDNAASFAAPASTIGVTLGSAANCATIIVSNEGPPLPDTLREHLFEPLISVREGRGGTDDTHLGLGLHVARSVLEHHGGSLCGDNLPDGSGVAFTLRIPLVDAPAAQTDPR